MSFALRRHLWVVQLCFLTLATYVAAKTVNLVVEQLVAPAPALPGSGRGPKLLEATASLDLSGLSRITGISTPPGGSPLEPSSPEPVRAAIQVKLLGTLLGTTASWSFATVLDSARQKSMTVRVGDRVRDAEVVEILRDRLVVIRDGRREIVTADVVEAGRPPVPVSPSDRSLGSGIRSVDESNYEVSRTEMEEMLRHLDEIMTQARAIPAYRDGRPEGFRFFSVRPDSVYAKLGIASGDVVRRINGFALDRPENALEAYSRLKDASRIEVELDRNGTSIRRSLAIR